MNLSEGTEEQVNLNKFSLRRMSVEQIRKNCRNMGTQGNFEHANTRVAFYHAKPTGQR